MLSKFDELVISAIRTAAAVIAGSVITYLVAHGFNLDESLKTPLSEVIFTVTSAGYYIVARFLEHYVSEHFGWLLLSTGKPSYPSVRAAKSSESASHEDD